MLTARQQEIWNYLVEYVDRHGYPPTVREIGEQVGLASPSTVHAHLANLERAGLLRRDPTKPRALARSMCNSCTTACSSIATRVSCGVTLIRISWLIGNEATVLAAAHGRW